ncbi:uncharacterized protein LDX57_002539 [Aspergillus melleus]|uniref:uncharacterized protein n=1 Tax=Aspergillus melleus TaxID=138277 RepID=UPI001E8E4B1B|nr:uncharacterized protein LDX57_002539 [Aspergillus melleus]KAH8424796.1 hypothetical protein LDX57_002539 [Aspergillus melleus]
MGGSSPPFLYGAPSAYSFHGPTDHPFNPKAVTQASWTRPKSKPQPKGPLVNFNRHPDSYNNIPDGKSRWTPMSRKTKPRIILARKVQLGLRVLMLLGALGSLFCAIVIKNAAVSVIWIVRVGPAVAILHTLYGIYHLCRSAVSRPPGSQASYMVFASTLDLGLIPFYIFTAFLAYKQYTENEYHWTTMLSSDFDITTKISQVTFLLSVVNGGFHLIALGICIFLAVTFRKITKLPPDMNPLEDNLTARPHKRTKSELAEKHASQSTLDSAMSEDPLMGPPRKMAFMHTRGQSSEGGSIMTEKRHSQLSEHSDRMSRMVSPMPPMPFENHADPTDYMTEHVPEHNLDVFARPTSSVPHGAPVREPSPDFPNRSQCVSPASDNWVAYSDRSPSPVDVVHNENQAHAPREPSSVYSRGTASGGSNGGAADWVHPGQRNGWNVGETIQEDAHGEYESLPVHEYYGHDDYTNDTRQPTRFYDTAEQDIGDHNIRIFQDHADHDDLYDDHHDSDLRVNPLALNPPTPQPILDETPDHPHNVSARMALTEVPNLSPTPPVSVPASDNIPAKNGRFYGELEENNTFGLNIPRNVSDHRQAPSSPTASHGLWGKKTKSPKPKSPKANAYGALKQHDDETDPVTGEPLALPSDPPATPDGDRKGRVVSNSGADFGRRVGQGASLSYGNYIAGLGVGRRRDVSGKMAEEGRGGVVKPNTNNNDASTPRAAGWARFAGL